jgi:hypothetical protein
MTEHIRRHPQTDAGHALTRVISRMGIGLGVLATWPVVDMSWNRATGDEPPTLAAPAIAPKFEVSRLPALPSKTTNASQSATSQEAGLWDLRALPRLPESESSDTKVDAKGVRRAESGDSFDSPLLGPAKPLRIPGASATGSSAAGASATGGTVTGDTTASDHKPRPGVSGPPQPPGGVQLRISSPTSESAASGDVYVNSPARLPLREESRSGSTEVRRRLTSLPAGLHLVSRGQSRSLRDLQSTDASAQFGGEHRFGGGDTGTPEPGLLAIAPAMEMPETNELAATPGEPRLQPAPSKFPPLAGAAPQPLPENEPIVVAPADQPELGLPSGANDSASAIAAVPPPIMSMPAPQWLETPESERTTSAQPERFTAASPTPFGDSAKPEGFANRPVRLVPVSPEEADTDEVSPHSLETRPIRLDVVPFKFSDRVASRGTYRPFEVPEESLELSVSLVAATPMLLIQRGSGPEDKAAGPPMPVDWLVASRAKQSTFPEAGIASGDRSMMPGESIHIQFGRPIDRVEVADPGLCRAIMVGRREIAIVGIRTGSTKLAVWPLAAAGEAVEPLIYRLEVEEERAAKQVARMSTGVSELTSLLADMYPTARVEVVQHSNGSMTLQGSVESNSQARKILDMVRKLYLCPVYDQLTVRN